MAMSRMQIYKCEICGGTVQVLDGMPGTLSCCRQPMKNLRENLRGEFRDQHLPQVQRCAEGTKVVVVSGAHRMDSGHFIQWIELVAPERSCRQFLQPGEAAQAIFQIDSEQIEFRQCCSIHGLWKSNSSCEDVLADGRN